MGFEAKPPANTGQGVYLPPAQDFNPFSPEYVAGLYDVPVPDRAPPGPPVGVPSSTDEEPQWIAEEGSPPPTPATTKDNCCQHTGRWYFWTGTNPLFVQLYKQENIRAIWIPQEPSNPISIYSGQGGALIYTTSPLFNGAVIGSEIIPINPGNELLTLVSASGTFPVPLMIYIGGDPWAPQQTYLPAGPAGNILAVPYLFGHTQPSTASTPLAVVLNTVPVQNTQTLLIAVVTCSVGAGMALTFDAAWRLLNSTAVPGAGAVWVFGRYINGADTTATITSPALTNPDGWGVTTYMVGAAKAAIRFMPTDGAPAITFPGTVVSATEFEQTAGPITPTFSGELAIAFALPSSPITCTGYTTTAGWTEIEHDFGAGLVDYIVTYNQGAYTQATVPFETTFFKIDTGATGTRAFSVLVLIPGESL